MRRLLNNLMRRCIFCEKGNAIHIPAYEMYATFLDSDWVHKSCVKEIIYDPEKFSSYTVDMALGITERIEQMEGIKKDSIERRKKRLIKMKEVIK